MTHRSDRRFDDKDPIHELATLLARAIFRNRKVRQCYPPPVEPSITTSEIPAEDALSSAPASGSLDTPVNPTTLTTGGIQC